MVAPVNPPVPDIRNLADIVVWLATLLDMDRLDHKFFEHYAFGNGSAFVMTKEDIKSVDSNPKIINVWEYPKTLQMMGQRKTGYVSDSRQYKCENVMGYGHNSLGTFTIELIGRINSGCGFEGKFKIRDRYNFDMQKFEDSNRSRFGNIKTLLLYLITVGNNFDVTSDWIPVKQSYFNEPFGVW